MQLRYTKNQTIRVVVTLLVGLGISQAHAISLQDLFNGESITVDDKLFSDWNLEFNRSSVALNFGDIEVMGLPDDPNTPDSDPGLNFTALNNTLTVSDSNFIDFGLDFKVTVLRPHLKIHDASLALTNFAFGIDSDGLIQIDDFVFGPNLIGLGNLHVEADPRFGNSLTDVIAFAPQSMLFQEINIFVDSGVSGAAAGIDTFEVRKSQQIPEPPSLVLVGVGLAGLSQIRQWFRQKLGAKQLA